MRETTPKQSPHPGIAAKKKNRAFASLQRRRQITSNKMKSEDIAKVRKDLRKTKSVIWSGIISFEEKFGKKWCIIIINIKLII